ncbi:MAG: EF-Tu/IF-2/RF-3 family GTPase, partial [Thermaerobacterales bacterium]
RVKVAERALQLVLERQDESGAARVVSLEGFQRRLQIGEDRHLRVVLKSDVQGSLEAIRSALDQVGNESVRVQVVHAGVGGITESDVMLASASDAVIIGFNVRPDTGARRAAEAQQVEIRSYRIIYEILDDVRSALEGLLSPDVREVVIGQAEVRQLFKVPGAGIIAGCYVTEGEIRRNADVRLIRDGTVVHEGTLSSLKRFQNDAREVRSGFECGIGIERFQDLKEGDIIEAYIHEEIKRTLEG